MQIIQDPRRLDPCVVLLGMFDGVHLGHQALIAEGRRLADEKGCPLCACVFEPHPLEVLCPGRAPKRLTTPAERAARMESLGVDILAVNTFTPQLAALSPEDFLADLLEVYQPAAVVCGYNFTFGRRGSGKAADLTAFGAAHGFPVSVIPAVKADGEPVSSSRIRALLEAGREAEARRLLGETTAQGGPQ